MKRWPLILAVAILTIAIAIPWLVWQRQSQPIYDGRTTSQWLAQLELAEKTRDVASWEEGEEAKKALRAMGPKALPYLMSELRAGSTFHDRLTVWLRAHSFPLGPVPPPDSERWVRAIRGLEAMGPIAMPYVSQLVQLATNNVGYGSAALVALGGGVIPAVTNLLTVTTFPVTGNLLGALANAIYAERIKREDAEIAVESIIRVFQGSDTHARRSAAAALRAIHLKPELSVPVLIAAINDGDPGVREQSIEAVGAFGASAADYMPLLIAQFEQGDAGVRRSVCAALGKLASNGSNAIPVLVRALSDEEYYVRIAAAVSLGAFGSQPAQCVPALLNALKDTNANVRVMAVQSLGSYKTSADIIMREVEKAEVLDPDENVREICGTTLKRLQGKIKW